VEVKELDPTELAKFQTVKVAMPLENTGQRATTIRFDGAIEIELGNDLHVVDQVVQSLGFILATHHRILSRHE
jgi:hypothetical protein